ncbi:MAG TPA: hypothetical protein VFH83_06845, partial [Spirochaetia bacterium]|nr:hypothetical protein [Spirochaetia bacterium]
MLRFRFLGIVAAVLFVVALPAMAATTVGIAGEVTYGAITNGTAASDAWVNAYMNITGTLDPNNSIELALQGTNMPTILGTGAETGQMVAPNITNLFLKSDLAGDFGLDPKTVDPVLYAGYGVFDLPGYGLTQYGPEPIAAVGVDNGYNDGMFGSEIGAGYGLIAMNTAIMGGLVNVALAASGTELRSSHQQALVGAWGAVGPVSYEVGWAQRGTASGYVPVGLKFSYTVGPVALAAMGNYLQNLNTGGISNWSAGAQAVLMSNYTVDFSVMSYQPAYEPTVSAMKGTGDVIVNITSNFGALASVYLNFDPNAASAFDTLEVSAW